jgi:hypothetical protein
MDLNQHKPQYTKEDEKWANCGVLINETTSQNGNKILIEALAQPPFTLHEGTHFGHDVLVKSPDFICCHNSNAVATITVNTVCHSELLLAYLEQF